MQKIAIFYLIGQFSEQWEENFYIPQIERLKSSGLYDQCQFIDIFVKGNQPLSYVPDKTNHVMYIGELEEDRKSNRKLYRAYNYIQGRIWQFSISNPDYKILFFHSLGVSKSNTVFSKNKLAWRKYLETLLIDNWKLCTDLLDYYECVGTDYISYAAYNNEQVKFYAPHVQGFFWWTTSNYFKKLDLNYLYQEVDWQSWLCELFIGTGKPKICNLHYSGLNHYNSEFTSPPYDEILNRYHKHLIELKKQEK